MKVRSCFVITVALFTAPINQSHAELVYDLAADWSDSNNPNGAWSYNGVDGQPLPVHRSDWDSQTRTEHFSSAQPAWSAQNASRSVPMAFKSLGVTSGTTWNLDAPTGSVGMHGQPEFAGISWTSPISGIATLSGNVWKMRNNIGRTIEWRLTLNGSIFTGGTLTEANPYTSANPFDLADGSGGPSALTFPVAVGDVISLEAGRTLPAVDSDFVGVNFSISVVPEASSLILFELTLIALLTLDKRQRYLSLAASRLT